MSLRCDQNTCTEDAEWECTCSKRAHLCHRHIKAHTRECKHNPQLIENFIAEQRSLVIDAVNHLKELRMKISRDAERMILIIHQACSALNSILESQEEILNGVQNETVWDETNTQSIKMIEYGDTNLDSFIITVNKIFKFKETGVDQKSPEPEVILTLNPVQKPEELNIPVSSSIKLISIEEELQQRAPYWIVNGFKNLVSLAYGSNYQFKQAAGLLEILTNPSKSVDPIAGNLIARVQVRKPQTSDEEECDFGDFFGDYD